MQKDRNKFHKALGKMRLRALKKEGLISEEDLYRCLDVMHNGMNGYRAAKKHGITPQRMYEVLRHALKMAYMERM